MVETKLQNEENEITLVWLGAAGFHIKYRAEELLIDPFLSRPMGGTRSNAKVNDFGGVSLILVSHGHFDHAMDVAELAKKSGARIFAPEKTCRRLAEDGVREASMFPNERHDRLDWNGVRIDIVPSQHIRFGIALFAKSLARIVIGGHVRSMLRLTKNYPKGSDSELLMDFRGYRLLFSGSGGGDWATLGGLEPDCFMLPFSDRSDLPDYYMHAVRELRPKTLVLHHFDDFFPPLHQEYPIEEFKNLVQLEFPHVRVITPALDVPFALP